MKAAVQMSNAKVNINREVKHVPELQDRIRTRAYELYEERGREDGHELDDWLQAEAEAVATIEVAG